MAGLAIQLLGSFRVTLDGKLVTGFESDKVRALLAYLAVEADRPHRREKLSGLLWPDWPERSARASLSQALYNLRTAIGDRETEPPFLLITPQTLQFNRESDHSLDVARLADLPAEATTAQLEEAVTAYRGPFLAGFSLPDSAPFEEWATGTREELGRLALEAVTKLAGYHETRAEFPQALTYARRGVSLDPTWEAGHRTVMRLLALSGERSAALTHYETCRQALDAELGLEPSEETQALFELLVRGEQPTPLTAAPPVPDRPPRAVGPCPYRGLAAFREEDAPFFFGRESFVARLLGTIRHHALVAVIVGSSGSGKSSVVYAGLIPHLREEGSSYWRIVDCRPGCQPFHSLAAAFVPLLEPDLWETDRMIETRKLGEALQDGRLSLHQVVERALNKSPQGSHLLLVLDQFEELYTLCPDPAVRNAYLGQLLAAAAAWRDRRDPPFTLLLTLRADFMGQALAHRPFADVLQESSIMMGPMTLDELRATIEEPAQAQGAAFEEGLVQRILDDVGQEPGNLPLLEFALTLLWERHRFGWLTHDAYDAIGRVEGSLARHADQVYAGLDPAQQLQARRLLVQLVRPGEGTEDTRRVATRAEVGEDNWGLAQHLADRRLVVTGREASTGEETAEVVHEALIGGWGQLRAWMDQDRAFRTWQERLRTALRSWEATERDEGALPRGAPLAEAEGWLAERGAELSDLEKEYIGAGVALRERRTAEREAQRQRELEAAQQLAEERARSAARLRRRAVWLGLALALALIAAGAAVVFVDRNATLADREAAQRVTAQAANTVAVGERAVALTAGAQEAAQRATAESAQAESETEAGLRATAEAEALRERDAAKAQADLRATAEAAAVLEREIAEEQARIAFSRELAAAALNNLDVDPERSVLLALQGLSTARTQEAENALHRAVPALHVLLTLSGHTGNLFALSVTSDGTRLATVANDGTARIWDVSSPLSPGATTGQELLTVIGDAQDPSGVAFSPDGERLATVGFDGVVRVWETASGRELLALPTGSSANGVAYSPDGMRLAAALYDPDANVRVWDAESGEELLILSGHADVPSIDFPVQRGVWEVSFSPDGSRLVTGGIDGTARVWDAESGGELLILSDHSNDVRGVAFSPDGSRLATASLDATVRVWDMTPGPNEGKQLLLIQESQGVNSVAFSPDGTRLATVGWDRVTRVWDAASGRRLLNLYGHAGMGMDVAFSPDGTRLFTANVDTTAKVWDLSPGRELFTLVAHGGIVSGVAFSPDGSLMATADPDGTVRVWDFEASTAAASGQEVLALSGHIGGGTTVEFSLDGTRLATAGSDGTAKVWRLAPSSGEGISGELLVTLPHPDPQVWGALFSPDGGLVATGTGGGVVSMWDAASGEEMWSQHGHTGIVYGLAFNPSGTLLATGSWDHTAKVWDAASGEELLTLTTPQDVFGVAFSPRCTSPPGESAERCGELLATPLRDGTTTLWHLPLGPGGELASEEPLPLVSLEKPTAAMRAAFSPDGAYLATVRYDGTTNLWDVEASIAAGSGQDVLTLAAHTDTLTNLAFSPDGRYLATCGFDGTTRVHVLRVEELIALAQSRVTRSLTDEECQRYLHLAQCP